MNDKIAIYLRLSLADGDLKKGSKDESNSIENQRMLLHDYIGKQEDLFGEIVEYVDDGYHVHLLRDNIHSSHLMVLGEQCGNRQTNITP